jgi:hypothetical protein
MSDQPNDGNANTDTGVTFAESTRVDIQFVEVFPDEVREALAEYGGRLPYETGQRLDTAFRILLTYAPDSVQAIAATAVIEPLVEESPESLVELRARAREMGGYEPPDFLTFFALTFESVEQAESFVSALVVSPTTLTWNLVEKVELEGELGEVHLPRNQIESVGVEPSGNESSTSTVAAIDIAKQGYLGGAPCGIDVVFARRCLGGDGAGVGLVDIDESWYLSHEDLPSPTIVVNPGSRTDGVHGTMVQGVVLAISGNGKGGEGVAPAATWGATSCKRSDIFKPATSIHQAAKAAPEGSTVLIEFDVNKGSCDGVPAENFTFAVYDYIKAHTATKVSIVEPAGNGQYNDGGTLKAGIPLDRLGDFLQDRQGRPYTMKNDSGAVIVGAADSRVPHRRVSNSNWGTRVDCYAWGEKVFTTSKSETGVTDTDSYVDNFGETSAASAVIAGAAVLLQSIKRANHGFAASLTPANVRDYLRATDSPTTPVFQFDETLPETDEACEASPESEEPPIGHMPILGEIILRKLDVEPTV